MKNSPENLHDRYDARMARMTRGLKNVARLFAYDSGRAMRGEGARAVRYRFALAFMPLKAPARLP
jgi:hypothetical protein